MTCEHCCGADKLFDLKTAKKELKSFRKKGASKVTKRLIEAVADDVEGKSLLDIGGGIGAIQWHFHSKGASKTRDVDASSGYLKIAKEYATEKGWEEQSEFVQADFNDVSEPSDTFDFVTLDKVICCYPDFAKLLGNATQSSNHRIGLSLPMSGRIAQLVSKLGSIYMYLKKNPFRSYAHDEEDVHAFILDQGFQRVSSSMSFPWRVWVYERVESV